MTISTVALTQQHSYQQTSFQSRKVALITPAQKSPLGRDEFLPSSLSALTPDTKLAMNIASKPEDNSTYEKPKDIKLQLMMLVLERFLGRKLSLGDFSLFVQNSVSKNNNATSNFTSENIASSRLNAEYVRIAGQVFQQGDLLSVEEWHSHKQQLSYQVQGQLIINEQELLLNYQMSLESTQSSYHKMEVTAAALKDPLIVQFGEQGLGEISSAIEFHINRDNTLDSLPIFSGDVGYLVYDKNSNQQADDGSELFGPRTGQGFNELAELDTNKNGFIDHEDERFEQLFIWQPSKEIIQAEQWLSLQQAKIQAISLSSTTTPYNFYDQQGQIQAQLRQSSFAINNDGLGRGVHQVDVRI